VLDPDVVFRADQAAVRLGSLAEIRGATAVAETFKGRAQTARVALADGALALAVILGDELRIVVRLAFTGDRISGIDGIAEAEEIRRMEIEIFER